MHDPDRLMGRNIAQCARFDTRWATYAATRRQLEQRVLRTSSRTRQFHGVTILMITAMLKDNPNGDVTYATPVPIPTASARSATNPYWEAILAYRLKTGIWMLPNTDHVKRAIIQTQNERVSAELNGLVKDVAQGKYYPLCGTAGYSD